MTEGLSVPGWCERAWLGVEAGEPTFGDLKSISWEELVEHIRAEGIEGNAMEILVGAWNLYHDEERSL